MSIRTEMKIQAEEILKALENLKEIEQSNNRIVQEQICKNIKNKITKSNSMPLVQEEVLEDNSIVLTISL